MANEGIEYEIYPFGDPKRATPQWIIPGRTSPSYLEEIKGNGGGSFFISKSDPKYSADPAMLDSRNVVRVKVDGLYIGGFLIGQSEATTISSGEKKEQGYRTIGEGFKSWFNDADVHPSGGHKPESGSSRYFNFASVERGDWYVPGDWIDPFWFGTVKGGGHSSWSLSNAPDKWPDNASFAQWFGASALSSTMPYEPYYIRWEFSVDEGGLYAFYVAADDQFTIYVDGDQISKSSDKSSAWMEASRIEMTLSAGNHTIAIVAQNRNAPGYYGPTAATFALEKVGFDGAETLIGTSTPGYGTIKVLPYPDQVPGWTIGEVVLTLLSEAQARGIRFPNWLTPTFTSAADSYGRPWTDKLEWSFSVGESYASVLSAIEELYDLWIDKDFNLHIVPMRSTDRTQAIFDTDGQTVLSAPIKFQLGKHIRAAGDTSRGKIKNSLLMKTSEGWMEAQDASSVAKYGRIESSMETKADKGYSEKLASIVFAHRATEEEGASYDVLPGQYVPFKHFFPGDWVLAPNRRGDSVPRRVMSISVEETTSGRPNYTIEFDTIFRDNEARMARVLDKLGGSGVGGSSGGGMGIPSGGGGGGITLPPTNTQVFLVPSQVTGLEVDSEGYWSSNGILTYSEVLFEWDPVTQNTNGTETIPYNYELQGHDNSTPESGWDTLGSFTGMTATLTNFVPNDEWEFRVRAMNLDGRVGAWSSVVVHRPAGPTTPMLPPSVPLLQSALGLLVVGWDGKLNDGNVAPPQFRYAYAEVKLTSGTNWTQLGQAVQRGGGQIQITGLTVGSSYDVRLIAVDGVRIASPVSASASITITGIDLGDLDERVTDAINEAEQAGIDAGEAALEARDIANAAFDFAENADEAAALALDRVNKSVTRVLDEYVVSTSSTTAPGTGAAWDPNTPDWGPGEFVWRRSKNTLVDGTVTYSAPVMITGFDGAIGEDAVLLRIDSTRGVAFKNNQISTTLKVTIFKGSQIITNAVDLSAALGNGSYLEWSWRRLDDTDFSVISSADDRLSQSGFALTISPADVDQKSVFQCILNTP